MTANKGATLFFIAILPYPWPPAQSVLLHRGQYDQVFVQLTALTDGRLHVSILPSTRTFLSQPIDLNSNSKRPVGLTVLHSETRFEVRISRQELLPYADCVATLVLPPVDPLTTVLSIDDPNAVSSCQSWIQNRKAKFGQPLGPRPNRQLKTVEEQATDLRFSILRLKHLAEQVRSGNNFLLGTLAGEMRASIYWLEGKDDKHETLNNPLLLRMASLADLPLPVFIVPGIPPSPLSDEAILDFDMSSAPRIQRLFQTDQVSDLQESLVSTVLRLGRAPGQTIKARDLIKELANTMGASHYDRDTSDFLRVLQKMETAKGDQVSIFMCQTADALIVLSEWVLSELKKQNLIG